MQVSTGQVMAAGAFIFLGVASEILGVMIVVNGISEGWLFSNMTDTIVPLLVMVFMAGPFVAIAGVYAWRRASTHGRSTHGRSTRKARATIVAGTLGIAGVFGLMAWTVVGPAIAILIIFFWVYKIQSWRNGPLPDQPHQHNGLSPETPASTRTL